MNCNLKLKAAATALLASLKKRFPCCCLSDGLFDLFIHPLLMVATISFVTSIILLAVPLLPPNNSTKFNKDDISWATAMARTVFSNINNLSIGNTHGVNTIWWGLWEGCYQGTDSDRICIESLSVNNPYSFIITENGNQAHVVVQHSWIHVFFLQLIGFLAAIVIGIIVIGVTSGYLAGWCKLGMFIHLCGWIQFSLVATLGVILIIFYTDIRSIGGEMQSLGTGGITTVTTVPWTGFYLSVIAEFVFTLLCVSVGVYRILYVTSEEAKTYKDVDLT